MADYISDLGPAIKTILARKYTFMDFWSAPLDIITFADVAADLTFPSIVVAGLPSGLTIQRIALILTCRAIEDTSGADNYIAAAKYLRIKKSTGAWGVDDVQGIMFALNSLYCLAASKEAGPVIIGDLDIKSEVDGNGLYNVMSNETERGDAVFAAGANLVLYDVQLGLRVFYS